ncbi:MULTISPECIES: hypothetical protein [unclassified Prochlorococcus]|nr:MULTISPECIES: hypothetical protein [unclassified Prochlorococcus]KGG14920.1 putative protein family PM-23 [Prochlorococcus sp. MIT 0602]KGG15647.1 putative protein family PM-23 [Prochlorococcus sp. MIT 0603]
MSEFAVISYSVFMAFLGMAVIFFSVEDDDDQGGGKMMPIPLKN